MLTRVHRQLKNNQTNKQKQNKTTTNLMYNMQKPKFIALPRNISKRLNECGSVDPHQPVVVCKSVAIVLFYFFTDF